MGLDELGALLVNSTSDGEASTEDLLDSSGEGLRQRLFLQDPSDLLNLFKGEVALVSDVLDLLAVALVVSEFLDDEGRGRGLDADFGGSVLALELDHHSDALPLGAFLDDVFAHLLGILH